MQVVTASSHEEALAIHRAEHLDLIITQVDLPGMDAVTFCSTIKGDAALSAVSIILVCENSKEARASGLRMGADAVYRRPIKPALVLAKAQKLLNISLRETYRVLLCVAMEGTACDQMFPCRTLDVSPTGMLMESALSFNQGDRIFCSFYLPDADTTHIQATGEIVRIIPSAAGSDARRYGIHFLDLTREAQQAIDTFLTTNCVQKIPASSHS